MASRSETPRFGEADLSNCERELIHLAGSIQPHGVLLVLSEPRLVIAQVSANAEAAIGFPVGELLGKPVAVFGEDFAAAVHGLAKEPSLESPQPLRLSIRTGTGFSVATALVHRPAAGGLIVELEDIVPGNTRPRTPDLASRLTRTVTKLSTAHSLTALADLVVREMRDLIGYDRVMVYRFDEDGHGAIIAEAKEKSLESFLHRHYPSSDIPQRARELYLRNKVRLIVDVKYTAVPIEPRMSPLTDDELDLSMSVLRSISPMHLQYLQNMGVRATLVASLVHEGKLWGLISCHHMSPRYLTYDMRAACELIAEVVSTRISALEHFAEAQAEVLVRRLEHRLIEATATDGDWRRALFDTPRQLLQPVGATGAALLFDGEVQTTGDVPSTPDLRALFAFLDAQGPDAVFSCASIAKLQPALKSVTPVAAGVLAVRLGAGRGEYLVWFRKEQLQDVTWGGDPQKPVLFEENMELSPRRSFAAWHQIVRDTAIPWTQREAAIAKVIGHSLGDIVLQIRSVRVLIAESQLNRMRSAIMGAPDPVIIADEDGNILLTNDALARLIQGPYRSLETVEDLAGCFETPANVVELFDRLHTERAPWRGELRLTRPSGGPSIPVALRADPIPQVNGGLFGFIVILTDLTARQAADVARERLQRAVYAAQRPSSAADLQLLGPMTPEVQGLVAAIWANAGVAVSEISDAADIVAVAPLLQEVEAATRHAARLSTLLGRYAADDASAAS